MIDTLATQLLRQVRLALSEAAVAFDSTNFVLAFSGGLDSKVLAFICAQFQKEKLELLPGRYFAFRVIHVNHGIVENADQWQHTCGIWAKAQGIHFTAVTLSLGSDASENLARNARYQVFQQRLNNKEMLVTAHHQNDQAETFLMRLMRRAGVRGLGAMRDTTTHHNIPILRPLLRQTRANLAAFAEKNALDFIADPSNENLKFDRCFVRHQVLPTLSARWPDAAKAISDVASFCQEADVLCQDLGRLDYQPMVTEVKTLLGVESCINLDDLKNLPMHRAKNAVLTWMQDLGATVTSGGLWERIMREFIDAKAEAKPRMKLKSQLLCRHKNQLILLPWMHFSRYQDISDQFRNKKQGHCSFGFQNVQSFFGVTFHLIAAATQPSVFSDASTWISKQWCKINQASLSWRLRQGADRFQPSDKPYAMQVKKLWQESGVPCWRRHVVPMLVYQDKEAEYIVAIAGLGVDARAQAETLEDALVIQSQATEDTRHVN